MRGHKGTEHYYRGTPHELVHRNDADMFVRSISFPLSVQGEALMQFVTFVGYARPPRQKRIFKFEGSQDSESWQ